MSPSSSKRRAQVAIMLVMTAVLCTPVGYARAQAAPKPFEEMSNSARSIRDSIVQLAKAQVGIRYKRGGTNPDKGFDCSGLIKYIMMGLNLDVPRTARQQATVGM